MSFLSDKLKRNYDTFFTKIIDIKSLPAGMYFVKIIDGERVLIKKFVKN